MAIKIREEWDKIWNSHHFHQEGYALLADFARRVAEEQREKCASKYENQSNIYHDIMVSKLIEIISE